MIEKISSKKRTEEEEEEKGGNDEAVETETRERFMLDYCLGFIRLEK